MRVFLSLCLTLLGLAWAEVPNLMMVHKDTPMEVLSASPHLTGCKTGKATTSLAAFKKQLDENQLVGPCRYIMKRTSKGLLKEHLYKYEMNCDYYTRIVFSVEVVEGIATYISTIFIEQDKPGAGCANIRMIRTNTFAAPQNFTSLQSDSDEWPEWHSRENSQLEGGDYLLEIPRTCLDHPQALVVNLVYDHEPAGLQLRPIERTAEIISLSDPCYSGNYTPIVTHKDYHELVRFLPKGCVYRYEREYYLDLPDSHIIRSDGKTLVVAQVALYEPMLANQRRHLQEIRFGHLLGANCSDSNIYAITKAPYKIVGLKFGATSFEFGILRGELFHCVHETLYNFHLEVAPGCEILSPTLEMRFADSNADIPLYGLQDHPLPERKLVS